MTFDALQEATDIVGEREFYAFDLSNFGPEYYTTHHTPVTESDLLGFQVEWTPLPLVRKQIKITHKVAPESFKLLLPAVPSFVSLVAQGGLDTVGLSIYRGFGDDYANDYKLWWAGYLEDINVTVVGVEGSLKSVESLFEDAFPKVGHQPGCNNTLFDGVCGLNPNTFQVTRTVTNITGDGRIIEVDGAILTNEFYTLGKMRETGSGTIWKHITQQQGNQFVLHVPIIGLEIGDSVDFLPGCDKSVDTCINKFNNRPNNVSMASIPKVNPVIQGF